MCYLWQEEKSHVDSQSKGARPSAPVRSMWNKEEEEEGQDVAHIAAAHSGDTSYSVGNAYSLFSEYLKKKWKRKKRLNNKTNGFNTETQHGKQPKNKWLNNGGGNG